MALLVMLYMTAARAATLTHLKAGRMEQPAGLIRTTQFAWQVTSGQRDVTQQAYRICVARTEGDLDQKKNLLWDSGRVESDRTLQVPYQGRKFPTGSRVYWQVEAWLSSGEHAVSEVQTFLTGIMESEWKARWISADNFPREEEHGPRNLDRPATYLRQEFQVSDPLVPAALYVSTVGFGRVWLNGMPVSEDIFGTVPSNWDRTTYYNTYEVTPYLRRGTNVLAVEMGIGYTIGLHQQSTNFAGPRLRAQIQQLRRDSVGAIYVRTDESWQTTQEGPVRRSNLYHGEYYDARMEMDGWNAPGYKTGPQWKPALPAARRSGVMTPQPCPGIATQQWVEPVRIKALDQGRYLVDMGQHMVGQLAVTLKGTQGKPVVMRHAEYVNGDTTALDVSNLRTAQCTNTYVPARTGTFSYQPSTVYQAFRFVEISGVSAPPRLQDIKGCVQYDRMAQTATFTCDNELLNRLHEAALRSIRGSYHGMPTDGVQRDERAGWTGTRAVGCFGENILLDNGAFYYKWLRDLTDTQNETGQIADTAPEFLGDSRHDNVTWTGTFVYATYMLYRRYGDVDAVWTCYDRLKQWVRHTMNTGMHDDVMTADTYGDRYLPPERPELVQSEDSTRITNDTILSTTVFYDILRMMGELAEVTGNEADKGYFGRVAAQMKAAYNRRFFDADSARYDHNTVTANLLSLALGLVPDGYEERVAEQMARVIRERYDSHVAVGTVGLRHLWRTLARRGQTDLAWELVNQRTYPGYGYMQEHGATTIWERWNGDRTDPATNSANHVALLGDLLLWYYEDLAGIRNAPGSTGYHRLLMKPCFPEGLNHVAAVQRTASGEVRSEWTRQGDRLTWKITVPANATARVELPSRFGIRPQVGDGIHSVEEKEETTLIELGSGTYELTTAQT